MKTRFCCVDRGATLLCASQMVTTRDGTGACFVLKSGAGKFLNEDRISNILSFGAAPAILAL